MESVDTVVVGAGQAGLAMSRHLTSIGREHVVLERGRVAERWRTQRWDSLAFQFPNWSIALPGHAYQGADPDGFAPRDEVLRFIEGYAERVRAPVRTGADVTALRARTGSDGYEVVAGDAALAARNVVVATGPYQRPVLPPCHRRLPAHIAQLHAADYRNPSALPGGAVLVVGSGASGCQIADELVESGRRVYLSVGRHRRVPRRYRGRDVFWWRREMGELDQSAEDAPERARCVAPLVTGVRGGYDVDLRRTAANGAVLLGRLLDASRDRIDFAPDAEASVREGDRTLREFVAAVDAFVQRTGLDAPKAQAPAPLAARAIPAVGALDADEIAAVVWATGYAFDFGWIGVPVLDAHGAPRHRRGETAFPGLYFLGLPWLSKAKSSFLYGVGEDAAHIASLIARRPA